MQNSSEFQYIVIDTIRESATTPAAEACVTCPRRSRYNTSLFSDVQGDQCLDGPCYQLKINAQIDREVAARPELVQIENGYRSPREQRPGAVQRGYFREIKAASDNADAETVTACEAAKRAIIVYGKRVGTTLTVCTDNNCPVHDPRAAARLAADRAPIMSPAAEQETEEEALERKQQYEEQRKTYEEEQERRAEARSWRRNSASRSTKPNRSAGKSCGRPAKLPSSAFLRTLQRT